MAQVSLKVPYSEKDSAKALGAKWDGERKTWYVPEGELLTRFEQWLPAIAPEAKDARPVRVDSYVGKTITGDNYFELAHGCNPFEECGECAAALEAAGWVAKRRAVLVLMASL